MGRYSTDVLGLCFYNNESSFDTESFELRFRSAMQNDSLNAGHNTNNNNDNNDTKEGGKEGTALLSSSILINPLLCILVERHSNVRIADIALELLWALLCISGMYYNK